MKIYLEGLRWKATRVSDANVNRVIHQDSRGEALINPNTPPPLYFTPLLANFKNRPPHFFLKLNDHLISGKFMILLFNYY